MDENITVDSSSDCLREKERVSHFFLSSSEAGHEIMDCHRMEPADGRAKEKECLPLTEPSGLHTLDHVLDKLRVLVVFQQLEPVGCQLLVLVCYSDEKMSEISPSSTQSNLARHQWPIFRSLWPIFMTALDMNFKSWWKPFAKRTANSGRKGNYQLCMKN